MRVFLVDDSIHIRQRLARMLAQVKNVEIVGEASQAGEATLAIHRLKPDVVLLDLHLTGEGTGIDVLQSAKREKPTPLVIILTNYPYPVFQAKCWEAGADFFFDKSTQFDLLAPLVERLGKGKGRLARAL